MRELNVLEVEEVNGGFAVLTVIAITLVIDAVLIGVMVGMQQEMAKNAAKA